MGKIVESLRNDRKLKEFLKLQMRLSWTINRWAGKKIGITSLNII